MMNIEFTVQVIAPDDELQLAGECYAIYRRGLSLDFLPHLNAVIALRSNLENKDIRESKYRDLLEDVDNQTFQFVIKKIIIDVDLESNAEIRLRAQDIFESSIVRFRKLEELLTEFYQFERIV